MSMKYSWKEGSHIVHKNPSLVGMELEKLQEEKGYISAADVLDKARPEDSVLHEYFEWNDHIAGEAYRLNQARFLIRMVAIEIKNNGSAPIVTRAFVEIKGDIGPYQSITVVAQDKTLRDHLIDQARKDIEIFERKYSILIEVIALIKPVKQKLVELKKK